MCVLDHTSSIDLLSHFTSANRGEEDGRRRVNEREDQSVRRSLKKRREEWRIMKGKRSGLKKTEGVMGTEISYSGTKSDEVNWNMNQEKGWMDGWMCN